MILFFFRRQKKNKELKFAFICQVTSFLSDIISSILRTSNSSYSGLSLNLFTIVALVVLFYLYNNVLQGSRTKKTLLVSTIGLALYFIIQLFTGHNSGSFNSMNVALIAILVIIWSILFFYEQLTKPTDNSQLFLYSSPAFWVVSSYFIYFAGTFFLFIYSQNKVLEKGSEAYIQYSLINGVFVIIKNTLLSVAMFTKVDNSGKLTGKYRSQPY
ncbi:MAG: hypothetical protein EKK37_02795 [Sphingobacteriales bacterium]|nr:MAG: hypothetical protein EKK37_02795 [Sphingobacteriales bacterium]